MDEAAQPMGGHNDEVPRRLRARRPGRPLHEDHEAARNAAKACRVGKGGVACAVLDVAAAVIDNVQALSATIPVDDDGAEEMKGSAEPSPTVEKSAAPAGSTTGAKSTAAKKEKPTTPEAGDDDGV